VAGEKAKVRVDTRVQMRKLREVVKKSLQSFPRRRKKPEPMPCGEAAGATSWHW